jgi:hypothetical protein
MSLDQIYNLVGPLHSIHDFRDIDWKTQFTLFICMDSKAWEFETQVVEEKRVNGSMMS